jgi:hypothetical protein
VLRIALEIQDSKMSSALQKHMGGGVVIDVGLWLRRRSAADISDAVVVPSFVMCVERSGGRASVEKLTRYKDSSCLNVSEQQQKHENRKMTKSCVGLWP